MKMTRKLPALVTCSYLKVGSRGVPFSNVKYTKGLPFLLKMVYKMVRIIFIDLNTFSCHYVLILFGEN